MDSYEELFVLKANGGFVNAVDFSTDDRHLFTGSNDGKRVFQCIFVARLMCISTLCSVINLCTAVIKQVLIDPCALNIQDL